MTYTFPENIQRGIVYLLKSNIDFYTQIVNLIKDDYFEYPIHTDIFKTLKSFHEKYHILPQDDIIIEQVKSSTNFSISDITEELELINNIEELTEATEYYLDLAEKFAKNEAIKQAIVKSVELVKEGKIGQIEEEIKKAISVSRVVDVGQEYFIDFETRWERTYDVERKDPFKLLLNTVNTDLNGGMDRGELFIAVAPAGVGKSVFLVNQGVTSLMENRNVVYVSLEMSEDKIAQRFDSVISLVGQDKLDDSRDKVKGRLNIFKTKFGGTLVIKQMPESFTNVLDIRAYLNQLKSKYNFKTDVLIVDYLELLNPLNADLPEYRGQQKIASELRGLGIMEKLLVCTATQTNRNGLDAEVITERELADSYGKVRPADLVLSLNQTSDEYNKGSMRAYIIKNRNGKARYVIPLNISYINLRITEAESSIEDIIVAVEQLE